LPGGYAQVVIKHQCSQMKTKLLLEMTDVKAIAAAAEAEALRNGWAVTIKVDPIVKTIFQSI